MNLHKVRRKAAMLTALAVLIVPTSEIYVPVFTKIDKQSKTSNKYPNRHNSKF